MGTKRHSNAFFGELMDNVLIAAKHFNLSVADTKFAHDAAMRSPVRAMACYRAIANSLRATSSPAQSGPNTA